MDKETLYALLGLGIGGLGGYFGQQSLNKRRASNQLSFEEQEKLAKISAGIDPETNLPFGQKPEEEGPNNEKVPVGEQIQQLIDAAEGSELYKDFVQQESNDPRFEAPTPDRTLLQALAEEGEDLLFGNVDYEDLGKIVPVGNLDQDLYMPSEANKVLTTAGNIIPRTTATEEIAGLSQTPEGDPYIALGSDGDIYLQGPALQSDIMLGGPTVDQRGTELVDNPLIPNFIEYLGGDEALTPKGEKLFEDIAGFFGFGDSEVEPTTSPGFDEMMEISRIGTAGPGLGLRMSDPEQRALKGFTGDMYMNEVYKNMDDPLYQGTGFNQRVFPNQMNFVGIDENGNPIYDYMFAPEENPNMLDPNMTIPFFNQGGRVGLEPGGSLSDDITDLMNNLSMYKGPDSMMAQLSDADDFLRAERLGEDNPRYNYTLGMSLDDLMPGLSFEAGVMDDAVFGPGMTSPDDYKFLKFKKTF